MHYNIIFGMFVQIISKKVIILCKKLLDIFKKYSIFVPLFNYSKVSK